MSARATHQRHMSENLETKLSDVISMRVRGEGYITTSRAHDFDLHLSLVKPLLQCNAVHDFVLLQFSLCMQIAKSRLTMLQGFAVQWTPNPWDKVLRLILTCLQDQLQIERLLCQKLSEFSHASCSRPDWISGFNLDVSPIAFHAQVEYMLSWTWMLFAVATTVLIRWRPTIQARFGEIRP